MIQQQKLGKRDGKRRRRGRGEQGVGERGGLLYVDKTQWSNVDDVKRGQETGETKGLLSGEFAG